ncbi:MAG: hypothetical protein Sylvanvirus7_16 [Sylvanvirus sp.]|uniref:Uncharacterized protein n=1 Tax=Sylvanvirus sp. TaxID=2487774 RepID=A0A3G5AHT4_9VIRU|nr:MAG: hypothetical protein Sylvanvirus7_16 [Sylvanvirus sp.]
MDAQTNNVGEGLETRIFKDDNDPNEIKNDLEIPSFVENYSEEKQIRSTENVSLSETNIKITENATLSSENQNVKKRETMTIVSWIHPFVNESRTWRQTGEYGSGEYESDEDEYANNKQLYPTW